MKNLRTILLLAFIVGTYGEKYAPATFNRFKNKAAAQEAHEAIRPTDVNRTPETLAPYLDAAQLKLYTLIWKRFVASQMTPALQELTTADIQVRGGDGCDYLFRSGAAVTQFPGFKLLYDDETKAEKEADNVASAAVLGSLKSGDKLETVGFESEQKFTEPPPRYSEAGLIKALESDNIGRPSTYATILRTIQDRDYVKKEKGKLVPTELGFSVCDFLVAKLPQLFNVGFTAEMEQKLDDVEEGKLPWTRMMHDFYDNFAKWLAAAKDAGAPESGDADKLLKLFDRVEFAPPGKVGRRTFDDKKFVTSVREKFRNDGKISDKQFAALLSIAGRYAGQFAPETLAELPEELRNEIGMAEVRSAERRKRQESAEEHQSDLDKLFAAFEKVKFAPPVTRGKRTYDDKKFVMSLRDQAAGGRALSEKQLAALKKTVAKYLTQFPDRSAVAWLGAEAEAAPAANGADGPAAEPTDPAPLFAALARVKTWEPPAQKGRFKFDDRKFFMSLKQQYDAGKTLSFKQLASLKKLAAKYMEQ